MTASRWCFTLNNPTDQEEDHISHWLDEHAQFGVFGREVGAGGTPHLQGFVILKQAQRLSYLRRHVSARAHYERARGTSQQARDYCRKDGNFSEFGEFPERHGKRTDLDELVKWSDDFTVANGRPPTSPDIAKHQPHAYLKYPRFKALAAYRGARRQLEFGQPNAEWQRELVAALNAEPDDRTVTFVYDSDGGKGKTWMCRYLLTCWPDKVQVLGIGKRNDIAHMIDETKTVYLFNVARNQMQFLQYSILENLKDRIVTSPKYNGSTKVWNTNVHVVVFGNEYPNMDEMTADRYNVITI